MHLQLGNPKELGIEEIQVKVLSYSEYKTYNERPRTRPRTKESKKHKRGHMEQRKGMQLGLKRDGVIFRQLAIPLLSGILSF